jgi:hypothetical protein
MGGTVCKAREGQRERNSVTGVCVGRGRDGVEGTACKAREGQRETDSVTGVCVARGGTA